MEITAISKKFFDFLKKYRYAGLILLIGLILMVLPAKKSNIPTEADQENTTYVPQISTEEKMASILEQIKGAGDVDVMLTVAQGEETVYQTNDDITADGNLSSKNTDTVTITDGDHNQAGLISRVNPPVYLGAVVVCDGADVPSVQLAIVDAVSKLTGLGTNRISVLKMK